MSRKLVYIASPIDLVDRAPESAQQLLQQWRTDLMEFLADDPDLIGFWPNLAYGGVRWLGETATRVNTEVLRRADAMVILWPVGIDSLGVQAEIQAWGKDAPLVACRNPECNMFLAWKRVRHLLGLSNTRVLGESLPVMRVCRLHSNAKMPTQAFQEDTGWDLYASEEVTIPVGQGRDVPFGIAVQAPEGYWVRVIGRSSTGRKRGLEVSEAVIDNGWRGPLFAWTRNVSETSQTIKLGERIAQAILVKNEPVKLEWADELTPSKRGEQGFGSSGK